MSFFEMEYNTPMRSVTKVTVQKVDTHTNKVETRIVEMNNAHEDACA